MTGKQEQGSPGRDRGPIPFERDAAAVPSAVPKPPMRGDAPTPSLKCPECGYSLVGIAGARCPECGGDVGKASVARERWARADGEQRAEYWKWIRIVCFGLMAMAAAVAFRG